MVERRLQTCKLLDVIFFIIISVEFKLKTHNCKNYKPQNKNKDIYILLLPTLLHKSMCLNHV